MIRLKLVRALGVILFSAGVALGLAFSAVAIWGDLEAFQFDRDLTLLRDASLMLRCPAIIGEDQAGTVRASFSNPLERQITLIVRAHISQYLPLRREVVEYLSLAQGEKQSLEWTVTSEDVVYGHLILVKVHQHRHYPLVGRTGSCGIVVLDLPGLTGTQVVVGAIAASLLAMSLGLGLWFATVGPLRRSGQQATHAIGLVAASTVFVMLVSFFGWWLVGGVALVVTILLVGAVLGHFVIWR